MFSKRRQSRTARLIRLAAVIAITTSLFNGGEVRNMNAQETAVDIPDDDYDPAIYLAKMSRKFPDARFTVEMLFTSDTFRPLEMPLNSKLAMLEELAAEFERRLDVRVLIDRSDKKHPVIHLIDKALGQKSELLDQKIDLKYTGRVAQLPDTIQRQLPEEVRKRFPELTQTRFGGGSLMVGMEGVTRVEIDVKNKSIRHIFTHCVDLDHYNETIWVSETALRDKGWITQVRFNGPKKEH